MAIMNIGIIGLGKMGYAIAQRAHRGGHTVFGFDLYLDESSRAHIIQHGITLVSSLQELAQHTSIIWLMIPSGKPVENAIKTLRPFLKTGSIIIDGGNSFYKDSIKHAHTLEADTIYFLDCGTSGGIHGLQHGFCLMVGGHQKAYEQVLPVFITIAAPEGVAYVGPSGTGHYTKMVHNGIEYGLLQAYAEGFHILKEGTFKNQLDLHKIAHLWNTSSVIRSFLLELMCNILQKDQILENVVGVVAEGGTGRWTAQEAHEHHIPADIIERSLAIRNESSQHTENYANKMVALLREQFGGHSVTYKKD